MATAGHGECRLVGYVVPYPTATVDPSAVRAHLAARLPAAMLPGAIVTDLPLSPNGKVDRRRLTQTSPPAAATSQPARPYSITSVLGGLVCGLRRWPGRIHRQAAVFLALLWAVLLSNRAAGL